MHGRGGDRSRVFHRSILRKRTDALVALCLDFNAEERRQLASTGHPTIVVGGPVRGLRHIGIDDLGVACAATEHLIELGHRQIAAVPPTVALLNGYWRISTWKNVLHEHGGNISATARALNMHRRTLQRKLLKRPVKQ